MKKLIILVLMLFILASCEDTFTEDPTLKESERIAVYEKAKTDTLKTIIICDGNYYIVEKNEIKSKANSKEIDPFFMFIALLVVFAAGLITAVFNRD